MDKNTPPIEVQLAQIAEQFRKIEGEGLRKDIEQGQLLRRARKILKDKQDWCRYVKHDLRSNTTHVGRLLARTRAADVVGFNELLNLTRTAIDILAAEQVPDGAILEALEMSKRGIRITEEIARRIADTHLEAVGKKRRKSRKKEPQPGEEVTIANSPRAIARHLSNYQPEMIYRVADAAAGQAMRDGANRRNSQSLLEAVQWIKPALPNPTAIKAGLATDYVLVRDGFVSAHNGSLLARSPCAQDGAFLVDAGIFEGFLSEDPEIRVGDGRVSFDFPDDDGAYGLIPKPVKEFCPKDPTLIDRYPNGERHALPVVLTVALASLRRLTCRAPGHRIENGVWLFDGGALVFNPPIVACVRDVGVTLCPALKVTHDVLRVLMKCQFAPRELLVESDLFWLRWANGDHIAAPIEMASESATNLLAGAIALIERCGDPAIAVKYERPTVFERVNGLASLSIQLRPDGICANAGAPLDVNPSAGANESASLSNGSMGFGSYANLLPFKYGNVVGLIGLSNASDRKTDVAEE